MLGFPDSTRFVLLDHRPDSIFRWLQSVDQGELAFVVVDPLVADPSYPLAQVQGFLQQLDLCDHEDVVALSICTVPPAPEPTTVNLLAPIGIGVQSRKGAQIILHDSGYQAQSTLLAPKKAA